MSETFPNANKKWTEDLDEQLTVMYNDEELDISRIALTMGRTPVSIATRLKKLKIVFFTENARGYEESMSLQRKATEERQMAKKDRKRVL